MRNYRVIVILLAGFLTYHMGAGIGAATAAEPKARTAAEAAKMLQSTGGKLPVVSEHDVVPQGTVLTVPPLEAPSEPSVLASPPKSEQGAVTSQKAEQRLSPKANSTLTLRDMVKLWEQQARDGDAKAMNRLGMAYDGGLGVEPDAGRAVYWYGRAAAAGDTSGMANYGRMLEVGKGIEANPQEASRWLYLAAKQGQREAQYNLGLLYEKGYGVPQDDKAAAAWFSRAAAQEQPDALARLGHYFREGKGVEKNIPRATLLLNAAAMKGNVDAVKELKELAKEKPAKGAAILFGQRLDSVERSTMRAAFRAAGLSVTREDSAFTCDIYGANGKVPGAVQVAACYGRMPGGTSEPLGFIQIDYPASGPAFIKRLNEMLTQRFGEHAASEAGDAYLWNLGDVIIATQYMPDYRQVGLMYMVPHVYHLTQGR